MITFPKGSTVEGNKYLTHIFSGKVPLTIGDERPDFLGRRTLGRMRGQSAVKEDVIPGLTTQGVSSEYYGSSATRAPSTGVAGGDGQV